MTERNPLRPVPIALALAVLITLVGCGANQVGDDETTQPIEANAPDAAQGSTQVATYQSATVYAAATDFYFEDQDGQVIEFRVSNLPEEQTIELPDNMLEPDVVEGPPEANPDLVGEEFLLIYDDENQLLRVERS